MVDQELKRYFILQEAASLSSMVTVPYVVERVSILAHLNDYLVLCFES